jgi:phage N-6-adenine-methyltransferase
VDNTKGQVNSESDRTMKKADLKALHSSQSHEWYTSSRFIEAVREVLGAIDLDPASCEEANRIVGATCYYTQEDDGLPRDWQGRVFLNPPYGKTAGKSMQGIWARRLIEQYRSGAIHSAILLVKPCVSERWFQPLWDFPVCFTDHRIQFIASQSGQKGNGATQGGAFVYLGNDPERFALIFRSFGRVVLPDTRVVRQSVRQTRFNKTEYMRAYMRRRRAVARGRT